MSRLNGVMGKFVCKTCGKGFATGNALGGHNSYHRARESKPEVKRRGPHKKRAYRRVEKHLPQRIESNFCYRCGAPSINAIMIQGGAHV